MKTLILTTVLSFTGVFSSFADKIDVCTANATWNGNTYSVTAPTCATAMVGLKAALCEDGWADPNGCPQQ